MANIRLLSRVCERGTVITIYSPHSALQVGLRTSNSRYISGVVREYAHMLISSRSVEALQVRLGVGLATRRGFHSDERRSDSVMRRQNYAADGIACGYPVEHDSD